MTVNINGTTGVSLVQSGGVPAGGIQANTVTTSMLQANSVNSQIIATGAIAFPTQIASGAINYTNVPVGTVLQVVSYETGAYSLTTTTIPGDDTIPQNTEGAEFMTLAITPKISTSKLLIDVVVNGSVNAAVADMGIAALFQDSTANAIAVGFQKAGYPSAGISFRHIMTSGTTSSTTFKVRCGASAGSFWFNGSNGTNARMFGGVIASSITIWEVSA